MVHILTQQEAEKVMMYNLNSFQNLTKAAREKGADIIVFPEDGIYGFAFPSREFLFPFLEEIPDPQEKKYTPCDDVTFTDRPVLTYLSCLAQRNSITLVANMGDKQKCQNTSYHHHINSSSCPPDGWYMYNTNVIFDQDGSLLAKYHKTHLYGGEANIFNTPYPTPHVIFNTSFGVTFATFTCYDILYCDPPLKLLEMGVRNFVFPTAWGNSYPFYTSIAFQQAWSWKTDSNLLAANQHFPNKHSFPIDIGFYLTGSGIYTRGYGLKTFISGEDFLPATGQLVVATLPKLTQYHKTKEMMGDIGEQQIRRSDWSNKQRRGGAKADLTHSSSNVSNIDMKSNTYLNFSAINTTKLTDTITVSYTDPTNNSLNLDCTLEYSMSYVNTTEMYAVGAYIGGSVDNPHLSFAVCSLVKCASNDLTTCGAPVNGYIADSMFNRVTLLGSFPKYSIIFPIIQLSKLELIDPHNVVLEDDGLMIETMRRPLLSASIWARVYPLTNQPTCADTMNK